MTYGWAILVVLIAISALAYFGVLSPDRFLPSKCTMQSGIACLDHKVEIGVGTFGSGISGEYPNGRITVVLQNALGFDLTNVNATAEGCGNSSSQNLINGAQGTFLIDCDNDGGSGASTISGSKYSGEVNVSYTVATTDLNHKNLGVLSARIE